MAVGANAEGKFDKLASGKVKFNEAGYLFVYVVNESNQNADVFFDDFSITHSSGTESFKVSQVNEFYPYGLATSKSWRAEGYVDPGLLYQSAFAAYDSLTGYYDFISRSYDPALGRFFAIDPAGQFSSPYVGMGNMPHFAVDPDGEFAFLAALAPLVVKGALITAGLSALSYTGSAIHNQNFNFGNFFSSIGEGAKSGAISGAVTAGIGGPFSNFASKELVNSKGIHAFVGYHALANISSVSQSVLSNVLSGEDWNYSIDYTIGQYTLPFKNGKLSGDLISYVDNIITLGNQQSASLQHNLVGIDPITLSPIVSGTGVDEFLGEGVMGRQRNGVIYLSSDEKLRKSLKRLLYPEFDLNRDLVSDNSTEAYQKFLHREGAINGTGTLESVRNSILVHEVTHSIQRGMFRYKSMWNIYHPTITSNYWNNWVENNARLRSFYINTGTFDQR